MIENASVIESGKWAIYYLTSLSFEQRVAYDRVDLITQHLRIREVVNQLCGNN